MRSRIEITHGKVDYPGKGQDAYCVRNLGDGRWLLALADGLTMNNGAAAAQWVIGHMNTTEAHHSVRTLLADLRVALASSAKQTSESETTLTAGLLSLVDDESGERMRFDFFAAGDSPVWCIFRSGGDPPFQRHEIHGGVYPGELGRVYSTVRLGTGDVIGRIAFGSVEIAQDEILVVCSDGLPESTIFEWDFRGRPRRGQPPRLCDWLFALDPYSDEGLQEILSAYLRRKELSDDASMIAARITPGRAVGSALANEACIVGEVAGDSSSNGGGPTHQALPDGESRSPAEPPDDLRVR